MSKYIEGSKHAAGTAAVEAHFNGANQGRAPGTDPQLSASPGGAPEWGNKPMPFPAERGVNYTPPGQAGHSIKDDPFSLADGFPGN